eukprot:TRINITY_DN1257_c0_g1_i1.p1 TRINITY_DN1257_c0_g1~~TRINITY_DN1257_c0_g1_i1.p1  ORF type:complete len:420 (+),score=138.66 TRINITY_DN1257_c0_g1_i1:165-1424(+)
MVLEATLICIDNSEWMRNGDYPPNRFQAQADAVNIICGAKTQSNPENTVGVLTMARKHVRILVTPTTDLGKILACTHGVEIGGELNLTSGIQIAHLALKHRQNKKQQQRIIAFVGSPIHCEKKVLEAIGKKLKKNNVALDIVNFGEDDDGKTEKLEALLAAVNSNNNSHIVHVPAGSSALSDVLISSPIFTAEGEGGSGFAAAAAASAAAAAGGAAGFEFGVDPNVDPELALALRVSLEEERARQEAAAKRAAEEAASKAANNGQENVGGSCDVSMAEPSTAAGAGTTTDKGPEPTAVAGTVKMEKGPEPMDDETALLEQALAMSMDNTGASGDTSMADASTGDRDLEADRMSVEDNAKNASGSSDMNKVLGDQGFVSSILASLPGVDPTDPSVKSLLESLDDKEEKKNQEEKSKEGGQ